MNHVCANCGQAFSRLRLAAHWPTSIPCGYCRVKHSFRFGHLIGLAFLFVAVPAAFVPMILASYFERVDGQIHTAGPIHIAVHFGSLAIIALVLLFVQGTLLVRFCRLRGPGRAASDS